MVPTTAVAKGETIGGGGGGANSRTMPLAWISKIDARAALSSAPIRSTASRRPRWSSDGSRAVESGQVARKHTRDEDGERRKRSIVSRRTDSTFGGGTFRP